MNRIGRACAVLLLAILPTPFVSAAEQGDTQKRYSEKQLAQQQRMTDCSAEAKAKTMRGADRLAFMKSCLSGGSVTVVVGEESASAPDDGHPASRGRMDDCNAEARANTLPSEAGQPSMSGCPAP